MNPTILSAKMQPIFSTLSDQGIDVENLIKKASHKDKTQSLHTGRMSVELFDEIVTQAIHLDPKNIMLGHIAGKHISKSLLHLFGVFISQCRTAREVLSMLRQYYKLIQDDQIPDIFVGKDVVKIVYDTPKGTEVGERTRAEFIASALKTLCDFIGPKVLTLTEVGFEHSPPSYAKSLLNDYQVKTFFNQDHGWVLLTSDHLDTPIKDASPKLYHYLTDHMASEMARCESLGPCSRKVLMLLNHWPYFVPMLKSSAAILLNTSTRTLTRKLTQEGVPFSHLVKMARLRKAEKALQRPYYNLQELALSLGFSDRRGFERAFKQCTGITPAAYRKQYKKQAQLNAGALAAQEIERIKSALEVELALEAV